MAKTRKAKNKKMIEELKEKTKFPRPKEVYNFLNDYVIGQDNAKKRLSVSVCNHYKRVLSNVFGVVPGEFKIIHNGTGEEISVEDFIVMDDEGKLNYTIKGDEIFEENKNIFIEKSNVLLLGNTGTGKTYMLKTIAKCLNIPCYIADTTKLTQAGYVGDDVETIILGLLQEADMDIDKAQRGIIVLDEIDKIGRKGDNPSITRDVGGEGVQQALLKIVEGGIVGVPPNGGRKHPEQQLIYIDTTNILFVGMGAFDGLDKIIERRLNKKTIGFNQQNSGKGEKDDNIFSYATPSDLKAYGMIPELLGRFPIITYTNDLTKEDLVRIIKEPKNALLKQYRKLFLLGGNDIDFTDDAIDYIAEKALSLKIGARGLRSIIEDLLNEIMFETSDKTGEVIKIDKKYIKQVEKIMEK